jgi:hypothetical protein
MYCIPSQAKVMIDFLHHADCLVFCQYSTSLLLCHYHPLRQQRSNHQACENAYERNIGNEGYLLEYELGVRATRMWLDYLLAFVSAMRARARKFTLSFFLTTRLYCSGQTFPFRQSFEATTSILDSIRSKYVPRCSLQSGSSATVIYFPSSRAAS